MAAKPAPAEPDREALTLVIRELVTDKRTGGLNGLAERFAACGIGHLAESWIGGGPNLPVSPRELCAVLGEGKIRHLAERTGIAQEALLAEFCRLLPAIVDRLTPDGVVPPRGDAARDMPARAGATR